MKEETRLTEFWHVNKRQEHKKKGISENEDQERIKNILARLQETFATFYKQHYSSQVCRTEELADLYLKQYWPPCVLMNRCPHSNQKSVDLRTVNEMA